MLFLFARKKHQHGVVTVIDDSCYVVGVGAEVRDLLRHPTEAPRNGVDTVIDDRGCYVVELAPKSGNLRRDGLGWYLFSADLTSQVRPNWLRTQKAKLFQLISLLVSSRFILSRT